MKVYVYPADRFGCGYARLIWPALAVQAQDFDMEVKITYPDERHELQCHMQGGSVVGVNVPLDADVIVFQRVTHENMRDAIPYIRAKGIAVVIDMDDDLSRINPKNPAYTYFHPTITAHPEHSWTNAQISCDRATVVTTTTKALQDRYARVAHGVVLKNYVPRHYLDIEHADSDRIAYGGSLHSHPDDVTQMGSAIQRLMNEDHDFMVIADPSGMQEALGLPRPPLSPGASSILQWPHELTKAGIGLAPLADTQFNAAKSWLKAIEYAAVGVPIVASPRADYRELAALGVPIIWADKPKDWYRRVKHLLDNPWERVERGAEGRAAILGQRLTYEDQAVQWFETWRLAWMLEAKRHLPLRTRG